MMVVYALVSAIIVLWMAYLPTLTGSILTILNIVPTHLSSASDRRTIRYERSIRRPMECLRDDDDKNTRRE